jgi:hypothetical protein
MFTDKMDCENRHRGYDDMYTNLLRMKYFKEKDFFCVKATGESQFLRELHEVKHTCGKGMKYILGNGKKIKFWYEVWLEECPLRIRLS